MIKRSFLIIAAVLVCAMAGCSTVKPWDRDLLAQKRMQLVPSPVDEALDAHIFFSKEAASGGASAGGGGCGCN